MVHALGVVLRAAGTLDMYEGAHEASAEQRRLKGKGPAPARRELKCSTRTRLLHIDEVPPHLAFNEFVHRGYRCGLCTASCCASALPPAWHNESLNIWTHAVAAGVGIHAAVTPLGPGLDTHVHVALRMAAAVPLVVSFTLSVLYHTFMAHASCSTHKRGAARYHALLCFDVAGVVAVLSVPQVAIMHYGFWTHPQLRSWLFAISALGAALASGAVRSKDQTERAVPLAFLVLVRWTCLGLRYAGYGGVCPQARNIYAAMEILLALGGAANALFIPERWFPGKLDYGVNSHNIMHMLTTLGAFLLMRALRADAACMVAAGGEPGLQPLWRLS